MTGFEELGLRQELIANVRSAGFDAPSALQRAVIPVLRRGGNAIIRASSGSGITTAYALALLDRFADESGARALVLVPTADRAERVASTIAGLAHDTNARVAALTSAWSSASDATVIVASAEKLLNAIEESRLKLDTIEAIVVDAASTTMKLSAKALETIFASAPREGQRVFISSEMTDEVRKLAEAHARKALTFPPRPAVESREQKQPATTSLRYVVAGDERKQDFVARLARGNGDNAVTLIARSVHAAQQAERALRGRGFDARAFTYDSFDRNAVGGTVFAYDAPFTAEQINESLRPGDVVICERNELPHLRQIADDANVKLETATLPAFDVDSLNAFRNEIRKAAREEDLAAQMLVLEPLFTEFTAEEVAAATAALLRSRRPGRTETASGARAGTQTWSRLFISVGERDGVRPSDIVGAITGESGIKGEEVGRVDIRDTFSVVEVASAGADRVIRALNGTTMKNRALRVDYDRKTLAGGPKKRPMKREKPR